MKFVSKIKGKQEQFPGDITITRLEITDDVSGAIHYTEYAS